MRLSQFEPGRINKKLTSRFEADLDSGSVRCRLGESLYISVKGCEKIKPPSKKLISLDQVLLKVKKDDSVMC